MDITLSCSGQTLKAHKLVLCSGSAFFEKLLQRDSSNCPIVHFHGVDILHLKLLVDFMYMGEVDVPSSELEPFISLADSLEVKGLKGDKSKRSDLGSGASLSATSYIRPRLGLDSSSFLRSSESGGSGSVPVKRRIPMSVESELRGPSTQDTSSSSSLPEKKMKPTDSRLITSDIPDQVG